MDVMNEDLLVRIERALGITLYEWQKEYILGRINTRPYGRMQGKTTAHILRLLFAMPTPLYLPRNRDIIEYCIDEHHGMEYYNWFRKEVLEISDRLVYEGHIITRPIITESPSETVRNGRQYD